MKRLKRLKRLALFVSAAMVIGVFGLANPAFAAPVFVTTSPLPDATTGEFYSHQFVATSDGTLRDWYSGDLDGTGLSLSNDGLLSGTPTTAATHTFQVGVYEDDWPFSQYFSLTVKDPASFDFISPATLPAGYVNVPYDYTLTFAGGTLSQVQLFEGSTLPPGLTLNSSTGVIFGTPLMTGDHTFTLQAVPTAGYPVLREFSMAIEIPPAPVITTESLPDGQVGLPYNTPLAATGTAPFLWELTSGSLPPGLSLDSPGQRIHGNPITEGTFTFTVRVTDNYDGFDQKQFTIAIEPEEDTEFTFIETIEVLNITANMATIKGEMFEFGVGNVRRGFIYGRALPLDENNNDGEVYEVVPVGASEFTLTLTGLSPGTTYNVCAFVAGESGYAYGQILQFTTLGDPDNGEPEPGDLEPDPEPEPGDLEPDPEPEPGDLEPDPEPEPGDLEPDPEPEPGDLEPDPEPEPADSDFDDVPKTGDGGGFPLWLGLMASGVLVGSLSLLRHRSKRA